MYDGIIFDVDGTIWDSTPVVEDAWNEALKVAGYSERVTADRLKGLFGLPMDDIIRDILPSADRPARDAVGELLYKYEHEYLARNAGVVYDGIEEMLKIMSSRLPLFIVSNCQAGYIEVMLDKTGFAPYITDHLCPGDTGVLKAANIKLIMERNNISNPLYVGDTQMDANACAEANVPIAFASYGFGRIESPEYTIKTPMDLVDIVK